PAGQGAVVHRDGGGVGALGQEQAAAGQGQGPGVQVHGRVDRRRRHVHREGVDRDVRRPEGGRAGGGEADVVGRQRGAGQGGRRGRRRLDAAVQDERPAPEDDRGGVVDPVGQVLRPGRVGQVVVEGQVGVVEVDLRRAGEPAAVPQRRRPAVDEQRPGEVVVPV